MSSLTAPPSRKSSKRLQGQRGHLLVLNVVNVNHEVVHELLVALFDLAIGVKYLAVDQLVELYLLLSCNCHDRFY